MNEPSTPEVWTADLDGPGRWPDPNSVLIEEERGRADRFHKEHDRRRWIRGRSLARTILADHIGVEPQLLQWGIGPGGKPTLEHTVAPCFNISHSAAIFVMAVHEGGPIGVDVELVRPLPELDRLLSQVLSPDELRHLGDVKGSERLLAFYRSWTAKEAILKCLGRGLDIPLHDVVLANAGKPGRPVVESVSVDGWHPERFQATHLRIDRQGSWSPTPVQCTLVWQGVPADPTLRHWRPTSRVQDESR